MHKSMILQSPGYCVMIFLILLVVVNGVPQEDDCPAGKYSASQGKSCKNCDAGRYQNEAGTVPCKLCQQSRYTNENARTSCKWCSAGKYISDHMTIQNKHDASNDCAKCPKWTIPCKIL